MVWPLDHRRQLPFGRRQIPFITPPQLQQAPPVLLRSHLYPVDPQQLAPAVQQVLTHGYEPYYQLPLRMGMQQWKKHDGFYGPQAANVEAYTQVMSHMYNNGPALQTARRAVPPHPTLPWNVMAGQLQSQMNLARTGGPIRNPLGRDVPSPGFWPAQAFDTMDDFHMYAAARHQRARRDARMSAMRRIRELDREYGQWTEPRYINQTTGRRRY